MDCSADQLTGTYLPVFGSDRSGLTEGGGAVNGITADPLV